MKVDESDLREESSSSLQSFDDTSSVLYDNETPETFDGSGGVVTRVPQGDDVHHRRRIALITILSRLLVNSWVLYCQSNSSDQSVTAFLTLFIFWKSRLAACCRENKIDSHTPTCVLLLVYGLGHPLGKSMHTGQGHCESSSENKIEFSIFGNVLYRLFDMARAVATGVA
ncbi:hypothetical protein KIN20_005996 [Parelaphostrongylus tenuis]|uniref:Uncharacterized protein n=1 Tax=Parelaphostrongylus tenuis TaxID=148309 RepID=A0AAD5MMC0_PARTN|nr:hypothetical protein KIN20_005996 [Parelaphostrongylus tenuis]